MRTLGQNMAWLLKAIECGDKHGVPSVRSHLSTNFIRERIYEEIKDLEFFLLCSVEFAGCIRSLSRGRDVFRAVFLQLAGLGVAEADADGSHAAPARAEDIILAVADHAHRPGVRDAEVLQTRLHDLEFFRARAVKLAAADEVELLRES